MVLRPGNVGARFIAPEKCCGRVARATLLLDV